MKDDLRLFLNDILKSCQTTSFSKPVDVLSAREDILNNYLPGNRFLSVFDLRENEFTFVKKEVERVLLYKKEEFTMERLLSMIPPMELFLVLEYAKIAFSLLRSEFHFQILREAFHIAFPILKKGATKPSRIARRSMLFELEDETPASILEIWEDVSFRDNTQYVKWSMYAPTEKAAIGMNKYFYNRWVEKLGTGFTLRELQTLIIAEGGCSTEEIAARMNISRNTVDEYFKNMKRKIKKVARRLNDDRIFTNGIELNIEIPYAMSRLELIRHAHTFGLLPDNILKRYFVDSLQ